MLIWHDKKKLQVTQGMASSMSSASAGKVACVKKGTQRGGGGGGGRILNRVLYGGAPPRGPTTHPFIYQTVLKGEVTLS